MPTEIPRAILGVNYYAAAQEYLRSLPLEHFMEPTSQAQQRKITMESFDLISIERPDIHCFNELLVQYPIRGKKKPGQVVPDNMIVIHPGPITADGSYDVPLEPVSPFMMLEYVTKSSRRKDYDDNMQRYERGLKTPYYLLFPLDIREITLYRHNKRKFVSVPPNDDDRFVIPELELECGVIDEWVRFWFRGKLVPLPAELQNSLTKVERQRDAETKARLVAEQRLSTVEQRLTQEEQARQAAEAKVAELLEQLARTKQSEVE